MLCSALYDRFSVPKKSIIYLYVIMLQLIMLANDHREGKLELYNYTYIRGCFLMKFFLLASIFYLYMIHLKYMYPHYIYNYLFV